LQAFLQAHPEIVRLLYAAVRPLRSAFPGAHFGIGIDGVPNPGEDGSPEALLVTIWTQVDPQEAMDSLHRFYTSWWLDCQAAARGLLCFDVGFE
jgi:hypothetical protein